MTNLINTVSSAASKAVLFVAAITLAGLGFAVVGTFAVFALAAAGVALIAAPFIGRAYPMDAEVEAEATDADAQATA